MNRPILSDAPSANNATSSETPIPSQEAELPSSAALAAQSTPQSLSVQSANSHRNVLAGALPEWDLVPLAQFVKRVKRSETPSGV